MATYESYREQTTQSDSVIQSSQSSTFIPVILQESDYGIPLMLRTRTELIDGTLPISKGGTGISNLQGARLIASNVDGTSFEEVDIPIEYLYGLDSNIQEKLNNLRNYTIVVTSEDWVPDDNGYYKEISLNGIKSTDNPMIGLLIQSDTDTEIEEERYAYSCIDKVEIFDNNIKLYCSDEAPTKNITLRIACV